MSIESSPRSARGLFINLGDWQHAQDNQQRTPGHGHKLDVDGRNVKVFKAGLDLQVYSIRRMLSRFGHVEAWQIPGNHDPELSSMIAIYLQALFENEPRVTIADGCKPVQVLEFGANMILAAHGDGAKPRDLPLLAASRYREIWGRTTYRRAYTGHEHHEREKEFPGMKVRTFGILAPGDYWHTHQGYDSEQTLDTISHHVKYGPRHRATIGIEMVRDRLAGDAVPAPRAEP
jgi:hypothetical protein